MNHFTKNKISAAISTVLLFSSYAHSADNLVQQGDFEGAYNLWPASSSTVNIISADSGNEVAGNKVLQVTNRNSHVDSAVHSISTMLAGHTYVITAKLKGYVKLGLLIKYSTTDGQEVSEWIGGSSLNSDDTWIDFSELYTLPDDFDAAVPVEISIKSNGVHSDGTESKNVDVFLDDLVIVDPATDDNYPSSSLLSSTYSNNNGEGDFWTANNILDKKLDVMRLSASDILDPDKTDGTMNSAYVETWLGINTEWRWATVEEFEAIHGFFNSDIALFLNLNGGVWSPKGGEWSVLTSTATEETPDGTFPVNKFTIKADNFGGISPNSNYNLSNTGRAPLLVREVSAIETLTIAAPDDLSIEAVALTTAVNLGTPAIAGGDSPGEAIASDIGPFAVGTHTITWSVTDEAGTTVSADQTITITDETLPVFAELAPISVEATASSTPVTITSVEATDLVSGTITAENDAIANYIVGSHTITWTATDNAGNEASTTQTLNVTDTTAPVFSNLPDIEISIEGGQAAVALSTVSAEDLVDGTVTATTDFADGNYGPGTYDVLWSVTDNADNTSTTTQKLIIISTAAKVVFDLESLPNIEKEATGTTTNVTDEVVQVTANDGTVMAIADVTGPFAVGTHTITWSATADGETLSQTQTVVITDSTAPAFAESLANVFIEATSENTPVTLTDIIAVDLVSGNITATSDAPATAVPSADGFDVTWTATDAQGNESTKVQKVIVADTTLPVFDSHSASINVDATGVLTEVFLTPLTASDNLVGDVVITNDAPEAFPLDSTMVTWTATDAAGNTETTSQEVIVTDNTAPVITLTGGAVELNEGDSYVEPGVSALDNVDGILTVNVSGSVDTSTAGIYTLSYDVSDANGNDAIQVTRQVTVLKVDLDTDGDGVINGDDAFPTDIAASIDTDGDGSPDSWNEGYSVGDSTTALTLDAFPEDIAASIDTDGDGSPDSWNDGYDAADSTTALTIDDFPTNANKFVNTEPEITAPANIEVAATDENGTAQTETVIADFLSSATATDVDGDETITITHDAPEVFSLDETIVTFTATDDFGSTHSAQAVVTVIDKTPPVITLLGDSTQIVALNGTYTDEGATALDNIDGDVSADINVDESAVDMSTEGVYTIIYTVADAKGLVGTATRTITVQDAAAPIVTAPENITVEATSPAGTENSNEAIAAFLLAATAEDAVDGTLIPIAVDAPDVFALGDTRVTFESTDNQGYVGTNEATITVVDTTKPVITLTGESSLTLVPGSEYIEQGAIATDIVDKAVAIVIAGDTVDTSKQAIYTVTYTAVDNAGNHAETVTRVVTVQDASAPVVAAPENITVAATDSDGTSISDSAIGDFLSAATAIDDIDSSTDVTSNAPTIFPIGVTTVTFTATDSAGNQGTSEATVTITDQTAPVITLTGGDVEINLGDNYIEPGVSALDNVDGMLTVNVSGSVDTSTAGSYTLTYTVSDAANNVANQVTRQVTVLANDSDGDGVIDSEDAFPEDAAETLDSDGDNVGDNSDAFPNDATETLDSDGDNVGDNSDAFPNDATESADSDGDGIGDNSDTATTDDLPPLFSENNVIISTDAKGSLTDISNLVDMLINGNKIGDDITVTDASDGPVTPVLNTENLVLTSGLHALTFSATDAAGNTASREIPLHIRPLVELGTDMIAEAGSTLHIPVKLSGPAAQYPVVIDYLISSVTGNTTGQVTFEQDSLAADLVVVIDSSAQAGDTVVIDTFTDNAALKNAAIPEALSLTVNITAQGFAPTVEVSVKQDEQLISTISPTSGLVTITADISDLNINDEHTVSFEVIDSAFSGEDSDDFTEEALNSFTFDPANLETGQYQIKITVTDNSLEQLSTEVLTQVYVDSTITTVVADSDQDGIADAMDTDADTSRLPVTDNEQPLQVQAGLKLVLGEHAQGSDSAAIPEDKLSNDDRFNSVTTITNFNIEGLPIAGESVNVVLPLTAGVSIPENAVYRKFTQAKGWFNFTIDENNSLSSAVKDDSGNCPAPASPDYLSGLIAGNNCIQLTIEDGGENDDDGLANGVIADPGVLAIEQANTAPELNINAVFALSDVPVTISASASDAEGDALTYHWVQLSGPSVEFANATTSSISFTTPDTTDATTLLFEVTVSDNIVTTKETVEVSITPTSDKDNSGGSFGWLLSLMALTGLSRKRLFNK